MKHLTLMIILLNCAVVYAFGVVKTSTGSGLWSTSGSWAPAGQPGSTDDVVIADGHAMTVDVSGTIKSLTLTKPTGFSATAVVLNSGRLLNVSNDVTINGDGAFSNTVLLNKGLLSVFGDLKIIATTDAAIIDMSSVASELKLYGAFTQSTANVGILKNSGTTSIVRYLGSSPQTILAATGIVYEHLELTNSDKTLGGAITSTNFTGNLTIGAGVTLNSNGYDMTVSKNWTNNGAFTQGSNTVTFQGSSAQVIGGSSTTTFYNLNINNSSGGVSLSVGANVTGTLTPTKGVLTTTGQVLTLISDATGTARIGTAVTGSITGNVTMQRYIAGDDDWRLLGTPLGSTNIEDWNGEIVMSGFTGTEDDASSFKSVYTYDETNTGTSDLGYAVPSSTANGLSYGTGYFMWVGDNLGVPITKTVDLTGTVATGNQVVTVTVTDGPEDDTHDGWNLISNPMPSDINWNSVAVTGTLTGIAYLYNPATDTYDSYNQTDGRTIPSMQGFWVKVGQTGGSHSETLTFEEADKVADGNNYYKTTSPAPEIQITLTSSVPDHVHTTRILFNSEATENYDLMHDGYMLGSLDWQLPNLGSVSADGIELSLNALPDLNQAYSVPLKITWGYPSYMSGVLVNCTLDATSISGIPSGVCLALEDLDSGIVTDLRMGSYSFVVPDNITATRFILHIGAPVNATPINVSCAGLNDGSAVVTGVGAGPWDYTWINSNGDTVRAVSNVSGSDTASGLSPDSYEVIIGGNGGYCTTLSQTVTIEEPGISVQSKDITCFGGGDGSADLTLNGLSAPYTYLWSSGQVSEDVNSLGVGSYSVTVNDGNGCSLSASITISEPAAMLLSGIAADASCYASNDGSVDITVSGGISPYTYTWSNNGTDEDISDLDSGAYTVYVADANGCNAEDTFNISHPVMPVIAGFSLSADTVYLSDSGSVQFTNTSSGSSIYSWYFGDNSAVSALDNPLHSYSAAGVYSISLTATDGGFCSDSISKSVVVVDDTQIGVDEASRLTLFVDFGQNSNGVYIDFRFDELQQVSLSVFDMLGREVMPVRDINVSRERIRLTLPPTAKGIYLLNVETKDGKIVHKYVF